MFCLVVTMGVVANSLHRMVPVELNHTELCRFENRNGAYDMVAGAVIEMVEAVHTSMRMYLTHEIPKISLLRNHND